MTAKTKLGLGGELAKQLEELTGLSGRALQDEYNDMPIEERDYQDMILRMRHEDLYSDLRHKLARKYPGWCMSFWELLPTLDGGQVCAHCKKPVPNWGHCPDKCFELWAEQLLASGAPP